GTLWYNPTTDKLYANDGTGWTLVTGSVDDGTVTTPKIVDGAVTTPKIADDAVTNAKLANMPAWTLKGNATGALGDPQDFNISSLTVKGLPVGNDALIIADSESSNSFKRVNWSTIFAGSGTGATGEWSFNATLTFPPSSGQIRLNNATQSLATAVYI